MRQHDSIDWWYSLFSTQYWSIKLCRDGRLSQKALSLQQKDLSATQKAAVRFQLLHAVHPRSPIKDALIAVRYKFRISSDKKQQVCGLVQSNYKEEKSKQMKHQEEQRRKTSPLLI